MQARAGAVAVSAALVAGLALARVILVVSGHGADQSLDATFAAVVAVFAGAVVATRYSNGGH
jgi:hypothetical protein